MSGRSEASRAKQWLARAEKRARDMGHADLDERFERDAAYRADLILTGRIPSVVRPGRFPEAMRGREPEFRSEGSRPDMRAAKIPLAARALGHLARPVEGASVAPVGTTGNGPVDS